MIVILARASLELTIVERGYRVDNFFIRNDVLVKGGGTASHIYNKGKGMGNEESRYHLLAKQNGLTRNPQMEPWTSCLLNLRKNISVV